MTLKRAITQIGSVVAAAVTMALGGAGLVPAVIADECVAYATTDPDQDRDSELGNHCRDKGPYRIAGDGTRMTWNDACRARGGTCAHVIDWEGKHHNTCSRKARDGSRAAWCVASSEDLEDSDDCPKPISNATVCDGLLGEGQDTAAQDVYVGLKSGCARVVHDSGAQKNMQIARCHVYSIPKESGWNCECL